MEPAITVSLTLPLSKAEQLLNFVKTLGAEKNVALEATSTCAASHIALVTEPPAVESSLLTKPFVVKRVRLADLLDDKLRTLIAFVLEHKGAFYNKDLAGALGVDSQLTSIYLGLLTKKLRKVGVNERNWYAKGRTPKGTHLAVRDDVMENLREAMEN